MASAGALAAALARLAVPRVFAVGDSGGEGSVATELGRHDVSVEHVPGASDACVMAAVTGELGSAPGVVLFERAETLMDAIDALAQARRDRSPLLVLLAGEAASPAVEPSIRAALDAAVTDPGGRGGVAAAARLALTHPRGPVLLRWQAARVTDDPRTNDDAPATEIARANGQTGTVEPREPPHVLGPEAEVRDTVDVGMEPTPPPDVLDAIADALAQSARPVVIAGLEARAPDDREWLRAFAEAVPAPVVATSKARGALPEPHPLALGVLGMRDAVLDHADIVLALGVDPVELAGIDWRWRAPVITVRPAPSDRLPFAVAISIRASIASVLEELAPRLKGRTRADWDVAELDRAKRALTALFQIAGRAGPPDATRIVASVREATAAGTIATVEERWRPATAAWQCVAPGDLVAPVSPAAPVGPAASVRPAASVSPVPSVTTETGLVERTNARDASFAIPAAVAARLARPDRGVVCFTDASGLEAATETLGFAARNRIGFAIVALTPCSRAILDAARAAGAGLAGVPGAMTLADVAAIAAGDRPVVMPAV